MVHIIFLVAVLLSAIPVGRAKKRVYLYWLSFFILFLFAALRYDFGNDYMSYFNNYVAIHHGYREIYGKQHLFTLLNYLSPSFSFLIVSSSFLFLYVVYRLLKRNLPPENIWMGLFIFLFSPYIFLVNLSAIRQCLAMLIFITAICYISKPGKNHFIVYVILVLTASLIHKSAILLLPIFFIATDKPIKKLHIGILLAVVLVLLINQSLFSELIDRGLHLFDDKNYYSYFYADSSNSLRSAILALIPLCYLLLNSPHMQGKSLIWIKLSVISCLLSILAFRSTALIRVRMYFEIFSIIAIPQVFLAVNNQEKNDINEDAKPARRFFSIINRYVFPTLIVLIYLLKYYSFFQDPMWKSFLHYRTILWR